MSEHARLTPEERQAIREREQKATPGPWHTWHRRSGRMGRDGDTDCDGIWAEDRGPVLILYRGKDDQRVRNAAFVVAARTDVPRLLADLEDSEREVAELREKLRMWETDDLPLPEAPGSVEAALRVYVTRTGESPVDVQAVEDSPEAREDAARVQALLKAYLSQPNLLAAFANFGMEVVTEGGQAPATETFDWKEGV